MLLSPASPASARPLLNTASPAAHRHHLSPRARTSLEIGSPLLAAALMFGLGAYKHRKLLTATLPTPPSWLPARRG